MAADLLVRNARPLGRGGRLTLEQLILGSMAKELRAPRRSTETEAGATLGDLVLVPLARALRMFSMLAIGRFDAPRA